MRGTKGKGLTIFLCVLIAILFAVSITFTLVKNDLRAKEKYYNDLNKTISEQLKD